MVVTAAVTRQGPAVTRQPVESYEGLRDYANNVQPASSSEPLPILTSLSKSYSVRGPYSPIPE